MSRNLFSLHFGIYNIGLTIELTSYPGVKFFTNDTLRLNAQPDTS